MSLNSNPKETCAKTWKIAAAQATHKNNYYNLQIGSFINHAILNKTTIKSTLGLQTVYIYLWYTRFFDQVYELQILVSVEKIIVVIEKQSIIGIL